MSSTPLPRSSFEPWRAVAFYVVLALSVLFLVMRLFQYQILEYDRWRSSAVDNREKDISIPTSRGIIYDRNGYVLASNAPSYNVVITPAGLPDDDGDIQEIYRELSALTGIPVNQGTVDEAKLYSACVPGPGIAQMVELGDSNAPYSPVPIICNVSDEMARTVSEKAMDWPGVSVQIEPIRNYPTGSLTSTFIGFLGPIPASLQEYYENRGFVTRRDKVGYAGIEAYFQDLLGGRNGERLVEVDVAGQELRNLKPPIDPVPGHNLVLTIDTRLQKAAESALLGEIDFWNTTYFQQIKISSGAIVAMNPKTGEILAMVSYPTFENNRMGREIPGYYYRQLEEDPRKPLLNHAVSDEYPPGSVFKLATATGALNEGVVNLNQIIQAPGQLILKESFSPNDPGLERPFVDWIYEDNPEGFGAIRFLQCIAYSSNVCFYKLGGGYENEIREGLGILRLGEYARALGYDQQSGVELLYEADGLIPSPQWKRINRGENWSTGDTYIASVGQGYVLATPLQVLISAATIANDGKQMKPTLVREVRDNEGRVVEMWQNPFPDDPKLRETYEEFTTTPLYPDSRRISPFTPVLRWDVTVDPIINTFDCDAGYCVPTGNKKIIEPRVIESIQQGMRLAVTDGRGTLRRELYQLLEVDLGIPLAGKTGTAEYCDDVALKANRCTFGNWPTHSWTVGFAPYNDPEIVVVAFAYNGGEGASVAGPMVRFVLDAYFELKSIDLGQTQPGN